MHTEADFVELKNALVTEYEQQPTIEREKIIIC